MSENFFKRAKIKINRATHSNKWKILKIVEVR